MIFFLYSLQHAQQRGLDRAGERAHLPVRLQQVRHHDHLHARRPACTDPVEGILDHETVLCLLSKRLGRPQKDIRVRLAPADLIAAHHPVKEGEQAGIRQFLLHNVRPGGRGNGKPGSPSLQISQQLPHPGLDGQQPRPVFLQKEGSGCFLALSP